MGVVVGVVVGVRDELVMVMTVVIVGFGKLRPPVLEFQYRRDFDTAVRRCGGRTGPNLDAIPYHLLLFPPL